VTPQSSPGSDTPHQLHAEPSRRDLQPGDGLRRRRLFGLDFVDAPDLQPVLRAVLGRAPASGSAVLPVLPVLVTPNVDIVVQLEQAPGAVEADLMRRARFCLPDGMPIVAASRLLRQPLSARLTGSGLFELLWPALAEDGRPVLVLSASSAISARLLRDVPEARFVVPPWFDSLDTAAVDRVVDQLLTAAAERRPELVLLGIGHPKDPVVAARLLERWPAELGPPPLVCCLGGSFAMYAGLKRRAPGWMQRAGLEWFYRFVQEPRRLFRRYFVRDLAFVGIVVRQARTARQLSRRVSQL
jgi:N-acetylglucosaminyldiphosphoundecaprenol N-acetyl-beta-D-mannosaminyltransferase